MTLDDDRPTVVGNLCNGRKKWAWMLRIMVKEGKQCAGVGDFLQECGSGDTPL